MGRINRDFIHLATRIWLAINYLADETIITSRQITPRQELF